MQQPTISHTNPIASKLKKSKMQESAKNNTSKQKQNLQNISDCYYYYEQENIDWHQRGYRNQKNQKQYLHAVGLNYRQLGQGDSHKFSIQYGEGKQQVCNNNNRQNHDHDHAKPKTSYTSSNEPTNRNNKPVLKQISINIQSARQRLPSHQQPPHKPRTISKLISCGSQSILNKSYSISGDRQKQLKVIQAVKKLNQSLKMQILQTDRKLGQVKQKKSKVQSRYNQLREVQSRKLQVQVRKYLPSCGIQSNFNSNANSNFNSKCSEVNLKYNCSRSKNNSIPVSPGRSPVNQWESILQNSTYHNNTNTNNNNNQPRIGQSRSKAQQQLRQRMSQLDVDMLKISKFAKDKDQKKNKDKQKKEKGIQINQSKTANSCFKTKKDQIRYL